MPWLDDEFSHLGEHDDLKVLGVAFIIPNIFLCLKSYYDMYGKASPSPVPIGLVSLLGKSNCPDSRFSNLYRFREFTDKL